jgi:hypothetical protein
MKVIQHRFIWILTIFASTMLFFALSNYCYSADFSDDFEDGDTKGWTAVDEPLKLLGDATPSNWTVQNSPLSGKALNQSANTWGDATDTVPLGTSFIYDKAEWSNFTFEVEVLANDNDGMGLVWRWKDRKNHYRFLTMFDPGNPPNGERAPWRKLERRLGNEKGDELPFYKTLASSKESYTPGTKMNWKLEAIGDTFKLFIDGKLALEAKDNSYKEGKIGFMLYAQSGVFFDNVKVTDLGGQAVESRGKLATSWGEIKRGRKAEGGRRNL